MEPELFPETTGRPITEDALAAVAADMDPDIGPVRRLELHIMATGQVLWKAFPASGEETVTGVVVP